MTMKSETAYNIEKQNIFKHYPVKYDKIVKGAMDFLEPSWSDISYFYEDFMKVWKPNEKGPIGRFEMRYKVPALKVPIIRRA